MAQATIRADRRQGGAQWTQEPGTGTSSAPLGDRPAAYDDQYQYQQSDWQPSLHSQHAANAANGHGGHGITMHANHSVPTLSPYEPNHDDAPPVPRQQEYDPTQVLDRFSAMHINDGSIPRTTSAMSYRTAHSGQSGNNAHGHGAGYAQAQGPPLGQGQGQEPIPRTGTSMSMQSTHSVNSMGSNSNYARNSAGSGTGLPMSPAQTRPPRGSSMTYRPDSSASDSITAQIIEEEEDPYSGTTDGLSYATAQDGAAERSSVYSQNSQHQPQQENMQQHQQQQQQYAQSQYPPQYQDPNYAAQQQQWQQQQQQQHPQQQQQQYDNYYGYQQYDQYAGAQDLPPGANQQYPGQMNSPYQSRSPYAQSVRSFSSSQSAPSMAPSMSMPPPSSYATSEYSHQQSETDGNDEEFAPRPSANREVTGVPSMRIANVKAVDLSAPPYTKQYVDDYRQRIKADPDPEAHFTYAKYLVDAAKKVGADAKDQRSVKKYRETLLQEALKVMRRLATQGSPYDEAQFYLANCYGTGLLGLQVDHERAYHLYLQAAKQNNAAASYRVAVCNEIGAGTRKEPARAAAFYRKAASLGDTAAMYKLGMILLDGALGEPKNPRDAVGWLKRAAEQADEANPHAVHELGLLHDSPTNGLVPYDPVYAKRLFTQAGQLGYTHSQFRLGQMYERGAPATPQDPKRSIAWYTKAAEKGHAEAELALSGWYLTGVEGVLKQSDSEAYLWARRAANKGLSKAEYAVGYYAEIGIGVRQDIEFAKRWYMRAAAQGNKRAMNRLTEIKHGGGKAGKGGARPTRQQAQGDCIIA